MSNIDFASLSSRELASYIQHTKISVGVTRDEIIAHAQETVEYGFGAAMVPGSWVKTVADTLKGTGVPVATALDFPTVGVTSSAGKAAEAAELVRLGADQIDIGVQIGWLKSGDFNAFRDDIAGVVKASGVPIKVMLELPLLTEDEKKAAVELSLEAGVSYLKNASSGAIETASPDNIRYLAERSPWACSSRRRAASKAGSRSSSCSRPEQPARERVRASKSSPTPLPLRPPATE